MKVPCPGLYNWPSSPLSFGLLSPTPRESLTNLRGFRLVNPSPSHIFSKAEFPHGIHPTSNPILPFLPPPGQPFSRLPTDNFSHLTAKDIPPSRHEPFLHPHVSPRRQSASKPTAAHHHRYTNSLSQANNHHFVLAYSMLLSQKRTPQPAVQPESRRLPSAATSEMMAAVFQSRGPGMNHR